MEAIYKKIFYLSLIFFATSQIMGMNTESLKQLTRDQLKQFLQGRIVTFEAQSPYNQPEFDAIPRLEQARKMSSSLFKGDPELMDLFLKYEDKNKAQIRKVLGQYREAIPEHQRELYTGFAYNKLSPQGYCKLLAEATQKDTAAEANPTL